MDAHTTAQAGTAGARRRRPLLASLTSLGAAVSLLGAAGVFAAGTDRATTGENSVESGEIERPPEPSVDLEIASATYVHETNDFTCGEDWGQDLTTGVIAAGDPLPYPDFPDYWEGSLCLRNVGTAVAEVTLTAFDVVDTEVACSPGEAEAGDATCGTGVGELSAAAYTLPYLARPGTDDPQNCYQLPAEHRFASLADLQSPDAAPLPVAVLPPGEAIGVCPGVQLVVSDRVQSDHVSWRYAFDAVVATPTSGCEPSGADSIETATELGYGTSSGFVCEGGPSDFYVFDVDSSHTFVALAYDHGAGDLDLRVLDIAGGEVARSEGTNGEELVDGVFEIGETYVVEVYGYAGAGGAYELTLGSNAP